MTTTRCPLAARATAVAAPIPRLAPVTSARRVTVLEALPTATRGQATNRSSFCATDSSARPLGPRQRLDALDEEPGSQMSQVPQHDDVERGWGPARPREAEAERMAEGGPAERGEVCARPP